MKKISVFIILILISLLIFVTANAIGELKEESDSTIEIVTVEVPEGIITIEKEIIGSDSQPKFFSSSAYEDMETIVEVEKVEIPEGLINIEKIIISPQNNDIAQAYDKIETGSRTTFIDVLNSTCSSNARFDFSVTGPGYVTYLLNWSNGSYQGDTFCSGLQCDFVISTSSWTVNYNDARAWVHSPLSIKGPRNAYRCE